MIEIDEYTGFESEDGPYRGYCLVAQGETLLDLLESAHICEVDQYGDSQPGDSIDSYSKGLLHACERMIAEALLKHGDADSRGLSGGAKKAPV